MAIVSKVKSYIAPRNVKPFVMGDTPVSALDKIGLGGFEAMDALEPTVLQGGAVSPLQFNQAWLPGFVQTITYARNIDKLVGIATVGDWADEEVVQGVMDMTGDAIAYGDYSNVPFSSWTANFAQRTIVRFEQGMRVGRLEQERAAKMNANTAEAKRAAATQTLEIARNQVGFVGYNSGAGRTYGFLNAPELGAYVTVASNGSTTEWSGKTFLQITADIRAAVAALIVQSGTNIDPYNQDTTLAVASASYEYLSTVSDYGNSVREWIDKTYNGRMRIETAPQLNGANGGANVFYLYAEKVEDYSTDGGMTFIQVVPAKFRVLGVTPLAKGFEEDYSNATAGVMCKRPYAVVRYTGI